MGNSERPARLLGVGRGWDLVGRSEELELLAAALASKRTRGVILSGAAGVGKTRLAGEFLSQAESLGHPISWAVATRAVSGIPFGALAPLLPIFDTPHTMRADALRFAEAGLLDGRDGLVLGIDDAHALDDTSAALVHQLVLSGSVFPVLTVRSDEHVPEPVTSLWKDELAIRLEVQPLSNDELEDLVRVVLGGDVELATLRELWKASAGNPLYLREILTAGLGDAALTEHDGIWRWRGPIAAGHRLAELIDTRIERVDEHAREVLQITSLVEPIGLAVLQHVCAADAIEAAEDAGLITIVVERRRSMVRTAHPMYAEVMRARTGTLRRRSVLSSIAAVVEGLGMRRRDDVVRVASWHLDSGNIPSADVLVSAAQTAVAFADHDLTERLARAALAGDVSDADGLEALCALGDALFYQGRYDEAKMVADALDLTVASDTGLMRGAMLKATTGFWGVGDAVLAERVLVEAEARLRGTDLALELAAHRAQILVFLGRSEEAIDVTRPIVKDAGGAHARARAWPPLVLGLALIGRCEQAHDLAEQALPECLALADDLPFALGELLLGQLVALWFAGRVQDFSTLATSLHEIALEQGPHELRGPAALMRGRAASFRGDIAEATAMLREATTLLAEQDFGALRPWTLASLAGAFAMSGDLAPAQRAIDEATVLARDNWMFQPEIDIQRAVVLNALGQRSAAIECALGATEAARRMGAGFELMLQAEALRLGAGPKTAERVVEVSALVEGAYARALGTYGHAIINSDPEGFDRAATSLADLGAMLHAAEAAARAADAHGARGHTGSRLTSLERARALAARCAGAESAMNALLDQPSALSLLTPREREIAELAARGLTKREVAEHLVLSVRTVGNHLYSIYAKLGVSTRDDLRALMRPDVGSR
jgi:DNA-binding CsgD family transcriptional regulator